MVQQLLSRGASPYTIPAEFYLPAMCEEGLHGLPLSDLLLLLLRHSGFPGPFKHSENLPSFASFLRGNSGKPSVVILDEFEKMDGDVQDSLLGVLQNGWYKNPFSGELVNCKKTIFMLTTNAADRQILNHWEEKRHDILEAQLQPSVLMRRLKDLDRKIRAAMAARTSRSLTSRVTGVIPFFPFTELEAMMVVQQELLNIKREMEAPPNEKIGRTFGSITVQLQDQPQVLRLLAKELHIMEEGARSVVNGMNNTVAQDIKSAVQEGRLAAVGGNVKVVAAEDPDVCYALELDSQLD